MQLNGPSNDVTNPELGYSLLQQDIEDGAVGPGDAATNAARGNLLLQQEIADCPIGPSNDVSNLFSEGFTTIFFLFLSTSRSAYFAMMVVLTFYTTYCEQGIFLEAVDIDPTGVDPTNKWILSSGTMTVAVSSHSARVL